MEPIAVIETPRFLAAARKLMSDDDCALLVDYLASNPTAGDLIPETGGVRKLRWALPGRGKRGGARVIYYFHNARLPLFALDVYAKNKRSDLSPAEKNELRQSVKIMAERYGK